MRVVSPRCVEARLERPVLEDDGVPPAAALHLLQRGFQRDLRAVRLRHGVSFVRACRVRGAKHQGDGREHGSRSGPGRGKR